MPRFSNKVFKRRSSVGKPKVTIVIQPHEAGDSGPRPIPENPTQENICLPSKESTSSKKLTANLAEYCKYVGTASVYDIVNIKSIENVINQVCVCTQCGGQISIDASNRLGLSVKIELICTSCGLSACESNSKILESGKSEINVRLAYSFRCIGLGEQAARLLGMMNLSRPTEFKPYNKLLCSATKDISTASMRQAVIQAVAQNTEENEVAEGEERSLTVALDGSWQKRGHSSQNGVVTAISVSTGKVIDIEILSKFCRCKKRLDKVHEENCTANYLGSSGGMEVAGARNIFLRSEELHNVRYTKYLGDGDTAAFSHIAELNPYGPHYTIEKLECVGHVQKRMGTRLRTLKSKSGKNKLSDDKTIGGRGRLTDAAIQQITTYYGLAIRRNVHSLASMKQAVWALYFHILSTDKDPAHELCPKGQESWCKYWKAKENKERYRHQEHFHLPVAVMERIKPIFRDLSNPELLKKCLHGGTQNPSESLNNMIWSRLPKRIFVMLNTLEFGVHEAIACYNKGNIVRCEIYEKLGIVPGENCVKTLQLALIKKADQAIQEIEKKCRQKTSLAKRRLEDEYEAMDDPDNPPYGAGMY